jgi:Outer membrane protein beta-barrel domain
MKSSSAARMGGRRIGRLLTLAGIGALSLSAPLAAQEPGSRFFIEGLGGAMVPTFDIADVAKTGWALGATVGYRLNPRWVLMGEFDYGRHKDKATGSTAINTLHYIAKLGYSLTGPRERGWEVLVNLGAGAVSFDVEGAPQTNTYFAINAGAKVAYNFSRSLALVFSPQGDIAFSKESELTTTNAWVWPFTAGLRINF